MSTATATVNQKHFMIDIETTGTKPGCKVLSIAVVPLFEDYKDIFYEKIAASKYPLIFHSDTSTMEWWQRQDTVVRTMAFSGVHAPITVLHKLTEYFNSFADDGVEIKVWGNGASFDVPILEYIYDFYQLPYPWNYRASMCYRTMKAMIPWIPFKKPKLAHDALEDARAQATHLEMILTWLRLQTSPPANMISANTAESASYVGSTQSTTSQPTTAVEVVALPPIELNMQKK